MNEDVHILGFAGSLRKASYNRAALRAAGELLPPGATLETFDLEGLPLFNQDLEAEPHPRVQQFKTRIRAADAILIVTPEYNFSMPGVLKNAIDCASRPYGDSAWTGKPVGLIGVSIGGIGTARAQLHLRQCFVFLNMHPVMQPEVLIGNAADRFDESGRLVHEKSREFIGRLLAELADWTRRLRG
jgi:chromate reductase